MMIDMAMGNFKDKVAIVGVGTIDRWGPMPEKDVYGMAAQAFLNCLDDCGVRKEDVDGVVVSEGTGELTRYDAVCHALGLYPRFACSYFPEGRLFGPSIEFMSS